MTVALKLFQGIQNYYVLQIVIQKYSNIFASIFGESCSVGNEPFLSTNEVTLTHAS